jgi:hypothetical protein
LKSTSKRLLNWLTKIKKSCEKVLNKIKSLKEELKKSNQKTININDPETC